MSKLNFISMTAMGVLLLSGSAYAELRWSTKAAAMNHSGMRVQLQLQGKGQVELQPGGHAGHTQSRGKSMFLQDSAGAKLWMITPTLESRPLELDDKSGKLSVPSTGMVSYHALVASRQEGGLHESSLHYIYLNGKPTDTSPAELMAYSKLPLEIVPDPMAREHGRFYSQNEHDFVVRFNAKPVSDAWVGLVSSNGSELEATSDAEGRVSFTLPDDFINVRTGASNNRPAEFMLRTGYVDGEMLYRTNFTAPYSVNPSHWESSRVGLFMLLAGFVSGIVVMRRGKPASKEENKRSAA
jgi:hypothetical protein